MLVVTNRNIYRDANNVLQVGEQGNESGIGTIRLLYAERNGKQWTLSIVEEPERLTAKNLPSRQEFSNLVERCRTEGKNCVFFAHGFNKTFKESLEQAERIEQRYGVIVVLFSWPSNVGGFVVEEYRRVKRTAIASATALDNIFEKLGEYIKQPFNRDILLSCNVTFSLMTYSMGNFVLQNYVSSNLNDGETGIFTNVVLCQADCDNEGHAAWVEKTSAGKRIYITINENDKVLGWSDANFQKDRLGRTARDLNARNATYVDFTDGVDVGTTHQIWGQVDNETVTGFFCNVLNGRRGEDTPGLIYDGRTNAFRPVKLAELPSEQQP